MAQIQNVPRLCLQSLILKDSAIWIGTMEFRNEVLFKPSSSLILQSALSVDEIVESTDGAGVTIETVLIKDGNVCAPGELQSDTLVEKTADAGVTVEGVLLKDNNVSVQAGANVQTDNIIETTLNAGVDIDGVLLKDAQVSTDVINELTLDAGITADGVLLKDAQVSTDVINELTPNAGVTADGVLLKDAQVSTDVINELTPNAGVTADGVLLKDNNVNADQVQADSMVEKTLNAGVTVEGVLLKDNEVCVPVAGKVQTDLIEGKTAATSGTIFGVNISSGTIPISSLSAQPLILRGCWDADLNQTMPGIHAPNDPITNGGYASGPATDGDYWLVNVAGTTVINGYNTWSVGDAIVWDGAQWVRLDHVSEVTEVNGQQGTVALETDDIPEGTTNLYYTDARVDARASIAQWNANALQGLPIDGSLADPNANDRVIGWDDTANQYVNKQVTGNDAAAVTSSPSAVTIANQAAWWNANKLQGLAVDSGLASPGNNEFFLGWNNMNTQFELKQLVPGSATGTPLTFQNTTMTIQNDNPAWNANKIRSLNVLDPLVDPNANNAVLAWDDAGSQLRMKNVEATDGAAVVANATAITIQNQAAWWNANRIQGSVVLNTMSVDPNDHCAIFAWDDDNNGWTNKALTADDPLSALQCVAASITVKNQTAIWNANQINGLPVNPGLTDPNAQDRLLGWDDTANDVKFKQLAVGSATGTPLTAAATSLTINNNNAAWNANQIQSVDVASTAPVDKQLLVYNMAMTQWQPGFVSGSIIGVVGYHKVAAQAFTDETAFPVDTAVAPASKIVTWTNDENKAALGPANFVPLTTKSANSKFKVDISLHQGGDDDVYAQYLLRFQVGAGSWRSVVVGAASGSNTPATFGHHQNSVHGRYESQTVNFSIVIGGTAANWSVAAGTVVNFELLAKPEGATTNNGKTLRLNTTSDTTSDDSTTGISAMTVCEIAA